jgi:hypothetical protein
MSTKIWSDDRYEAAWVRNLDNPEKSSVDEVESVHDIDGAYAWIKKYRIDQEIDLEARLNQLQAEGQIYITSCAKCGPETLSEGRMMGSCLQITSEQIFDMSDVQLEPLIETEMSLRGRSHGINRISGIFGAESPSSRFDYICVPKMVDENSLVLLHTKLIKTVSNTFLNINSVKLTKSTARYSIRLLNQEPVLIQDPVLVQDPILVQEPVLK